MSRLLWIIYVQPLWKIQLASAAGVWLWALLLSVLIEWVQFRFRLGNCEADDVIMNTLGAAVGTISFCLYRRRT